MTTNMTFAEMAPEVRKRAESVGALVVESVVALERASLSATVTYPEFLAILAHMKPRLVYVSVERFDAALSTRLSFEIEDDEAGTLDFPAVKRFMAQWGHRDGEVYRILLGLMADGVFHTVVKEAEWLAKFDEEADSVFEEAEREAEAQRAGEIRLKTEKLDVLVKQLIADPRFSGPKVGIAKRQTLARALFPDFDAATIKEIVQEAEQRYWLASTQR